MQQSVILNFLKFFLSACAVCLCSVAIAEPGNVAALRAKYVSLSEQLRQNQFKRPLVLESTEAPNRLQGDIYALIDHPFAAVNAGLNSPDHWCEVMILHINTKYCHAAVGAAGTTLQVNIGKKTPQELASSSRVDFSYKVAVATAEYLEIKLTAKDGPMGTSDYRILLDAVALPNGKTFLHLTYSYAVGFSGRLAMNVYLATIGRSKVGFTVTGKQDDNQPVYISGVRSVVERNTMRYYLAIESFLSAADAAPATQSEKRFQSWFTASEVYYRQLHDVNRSEYMAMKRAEYVRQQTEQ